jgi:Transposase
MVRPPAELPPSSLSPPVPDAHTLADVVRTEAHQLRQVAADSEQAAAVKMVARAHKTLIWERTRHVQRLHHHLLGYSRRNGAAKLWTIVKPLAIEDR